MYKFNVKVLKFPNGSRTLSDHQEPQRVWKDAEFPKFGIQSGSIALS